MNATGKPELAKARATTQQNGRVTTCRVTHLPVNGAGRLGDPGLRGHLLFRAWPHDLGQSDQKLREVKRLCNVVHGARPDQAHGLINRSLSCDEEKCRRVTGPRQGFIKLFAGAVRESDIANDCVDWFSRCPDRGQRAQHLTVPLNFSPFQLQALY